MSAEVAVKQLSRFNRDQLMRIASLLAVTVSLMSLVSLITNKHTRKVIIECSSSRNSSRLINGANNCPAGLVKTANLRAQDIVLVGDILDYPHVICVGQK